MRFIPAVALLGALGLSTCGDESEPQTTTTTSTITTTTTNPPPDTRDNRLEQILGKEHDHLADTLLQQYGNQPEKVRAAAERFRNTNWKMAVALYQGIGDTDTATTILREKFRGDDCGNMGWSYVTQCEGLGFQPTADDQLERFISRGYVGDQHRDPSSATAHNACWKSKDNEAKKRLAGRLENGTEKGLAIYCYRQAGDEENATRIAHSYFVSDSNDFLMNVERQLLSWGFSMIPASWYIERGNRMFATADFEEGLSHAFDAYRKVGYQEGMQKSLERAEREKRFLRASSFADWMGLADRAKELARQGVREFIGGTPDSLRQSLESYGLQAEAPAILQELGNDHFQRGNYAPALGFFEAANDPQGVQRTLDKLTTPAVE